MTRVRSARPGGRTGASGADGASAVQRYRIEVALVGCCGWSEAQARYVRDFPAIELQSTFYQPPADSVAERWKGIAPPEFVFCMKAWQLITHTPSSPTYRRLRSGISAGERDLYGSFRQTEQVWLAWERTREIARIIDARVIVFQCPGSFLPTAENVENLGAFFRAVEREGRVFAWEPRGPDWTSPIVRRVCGRSGLIHCVDPFGAESATAGPVYWRLHGKSGYRYRYTDDDLTDLQRMLDGQPAGGYVMFNNIYSRQDGMRFLERLS